MGQTNNLRTVVATLATALLCCITLPSFADETPATQSYDNPHHFGSEGKPHVLPWRTPESFATQGAALTGSPLTYYGGRVVSNMQVIQVLWGTGSYLPGVSATAAPSLASFYQQALNSSYVDWLAEYNTVGLNSPTSNQTIGRGSFLRQIAVTPSAAAAGATINDSAIQTELTAQIAAGILPAPQLDANGKSNTFYAIFFPHGKKIVQGTSTSCQTGGFCAYHGTVAGTTAFKELLYGVHPDMQAGSGCDVGCGGSTSLFANQTSVASHEMVETMTDAEVGIATTYAPPLAWYNTTKGEIGDICNGQQGSFVGTDGITYTVQKEWSNLANACVVNNVIVPSSDFALVVSPTTVTMKVGASASTTVTLADLGTAAVSVKLVASGLPSNMTATFSPSTAAVSTTGGSSSLALKSSSKTPKGSYTVTITGTAGSFKHSTTLLVTVQ